MPALPTKSAPRGRKPLPAARTAATKPQLSRPRAPDKREFDTGRYNGWVLLACLFGLLVLGLLAGFGISGYIAPNSARPPLDIGTLREQRTGKILIPLRGQDNCRKLL